MDYQLIWWPKPSNWWYILWGVTCTLWPCIVTYSLPIDVYLLVTVILQTVFSWWEKFVNSKFMSHQSSFKWSVFTVCTGSDSGGVSYMFVWEVQRSWERVATKRPNEGVEADGFLIDFNQVLKELYTISHFSISASLT